MVTRIQPYARLSPLVLTLFYPLHLPQYFDLPTIAYQNISIPKTTSHRVDSHLAQSRIHFTIQADTYRAAKAVADQVRACWAGYRATVDGVRIDGALVQDERDGWSEQHGAPVVRVDVMVWHHE